MGAHSSAHDLMAGVESDAIRVRAAALAVQMTDWLATPVTDFDNPVYNISYENGVEGATSDLVEWCRSARDVLEAVGRG